MANTMTPEFRVSYPHVFKPQKNDLSGEMEYSLVALFPKGADLSKLKEAAQQAIVDKWGADKSKWPSNLRSPFRDQGERKKDGVLPAGYEEGAVFINMKSKQKPGVVDQNVQDIIDETQFYAGCWARATVRAYAYDQKGNRGVAFGLRNIQKLRDGEPLGGRTRPEDDFEPIDTGDGDAGGEGKPATSLFD